MHDKINKYQQISQSSCRIKSISHLIISYDERIELPIDFNQWFHIGELLDELSNSIISVLKELEESELEKISKFSKK